MSYSATYSPRFTVTVDGKQYQEPGGRIADLVVETVIDGADRFACTLNFPFDPEHHDFSGLPWGRFKIGKPVSISMGYGGGGAFEPLFVGSIHSIRTDFSPDVGPTISVSGYGLLHATTTESRDRSWTKKKVSAVVEDVLGSYGFSNVDVESSGIKREKVIQNQESDYQLLDRLASKYGYQFYAQRDEVYFTRRTSMGDSPVETLRWGEALHQFAGEINEANEVKKVEVRYWDMKNEKEVVGTAKAGKTQTDTGAKKVFRAPARSKKDADEIAQTKLDTFSKGLATGHGEADGNPAIVAGKTITLGDMGPKFTGDYYVTTATHRMGSSGYRTTFEVTEVPS